MKPSIHCVDRSGSTEMAYEFKVQTQTAELGLKNYSLEINHACALLPRDSDVHVENEKTTERKSSGDSFLQFIIHIKRSDKRA
jgi:hypothetical protein